MPQYWLISDRNNGGTGTGRNIAGLTYWTCDRGPLDNMNNWQKVSPALFRKLLADAADAFPARWPAIDLPKKTTSFSRSRSL